MQQLREMFMQLSAYLIPLSATPQQPPPPSQQQHVPQSGTKPAVINDITRSWASIHATLPQRQFSSGGTSSSSNDSNSDRHPQRQKRRSSH